MKPLLADNWIEDHISFPIIGQPKIDGVRALNLTGNLTGRSLKPFKNKHLTSQFSHSSLIGFDGEMAAERETHPDLCRLTSQATGTIKGEPYVLWWLFDYVTTDMINCHVRYEDRLSCLKQEVWDVRKYNKELWNHLRIIPSTVLNSIEELDAFDSANLEAGYEGTILRDPDALYKQGRSGKKPILWRIKRFVDFEFEVHEIIEGETNENEAQINELGQTFRSSHQENKVANGMLGAMLGRVLGDVRDGDKLLFSKGQEVKVSAGCLTHEQRKNYFTFQDDFKGKIHKAKFFPKGIKDKPRFPTWQSFRNSEDM